MKLRYHTSRPCSSIEPRSHCDETLRRRTYGPVQPMDDEPRDRGPFFWTCWGLIAVFLGLLAGHVIVVAFG